MAERVLLIDDEKEFLENLSQRMELRGMEVSTATSGDEAVNAVDNGAYDAIVLDLQMPGMDGLEVLRQIKKTHPEMQVILLSGQATLEKGIEAMKLGAMDFMEKPADIDALAERVKKAKYRKLVLVEKGTESKMKEIMGTKAW
ncbi:MAG: response regulator [Desulfovibrio sp.]|uniref:response regulator n=1 Tax=Desulfovibrio sp. 7SRBS1 TaxID=3378064 RepID=UPI003B422FED